MIIHGQAGGGTESENKKWVHVILVKNLRSGAFLVKNLRSGSKYRRFYQKIDFFSIFGQKHKRDSGVFFRILGKIRNGITIFWSIRRSRGDSPPLAHI